MNKRQNTIRERTFELLREGVRPRDMLDRIDLPDVQPEEIGESLTWLESVGRVENRRGEYVAKIDDQLPLSVRRRFFPRVYQ